MAPTVPVVEGADHADARRIGRPDGEARATDAVAHLGMRAQLQVDAMVVALSEQVEVVVGEFRREVVGIGTHHARAIAIADAQPVGNDRPAMRQRTLEQAGRMQAGQGMGQRGILVLPECGDLDGIRLQHAHHAQRRSGGLRILVVTEYRSRRPVARRHQRLDVVPRQLCRVAHLRSSLWPVARRRLQITGWTFQMRSAYCLMLRSLENVPIDRMLVAARRVQSSSSRNAASTCRCASE